MRQPILVLNVGSSSLKFSVYETGDGRAPEAGVRGQVENIGHAARLQASDGEGRTLVDRALTGSTAEDAVVSVQQWLADHLGPANTLHGIGHRVVHGGLDFSSPVTIDDCVMAGLERLIPLAPLHQPHNIAAIRALRTAAPEVRQVACFDTAFHARQPDVAARFALPRELTAKGIRRYGFHGLSYEYIVSALPRVAPDLASARLVVAHLGNGASLCAIDDRRSIATTMSFTPLDGLPMGTRIGALDPGVVLYLLQQEAMTVEAIERLLYEESGLLGVSGLSSDMQALLASNAPGAREAVDLFIYRIGRELGSLIAALGGLDALIFTGGIGEHAVPIRSRVCNDARWIGIELDEAANAAHGPRLSTAASKVQAWVIPTDENLMIARHTRRLLDD
jgi:acetate kinase